MSGNNESEKKEEDDEQAMKDITDPRESDVLCGRGGAALRHPGNQTYRRLVNLNKSLYITCLKTEKLKISRSIVAAIREQKGRFLERDSKKQTWYDIGDKKAIEKTSQALREGQPKLRQKMIDQGQIAPNQGTNNMENQYGNGIYNPGSRPPSMGGGSTGGSGIYPSDGSHFSLNSITGPSSMQLPTSFTGSTMDMPPPPSRQMSNEPMNPDVLMQRLSLTSMAARSIPSWTPSMTSMDADTRSSMRSRMRPSLQGGSGVSDGFGFMSESSMSFMSDFSAYGMNDGSFAGNQQQQMMSNVASMPNNNQFSNHGSMQSNNSNNFNMPPPPPMSSLGMESPQMRTNYDRRRLFAKMQNARHSPQGRNHKSQRSTTDGMPDIHMVDAGLSLLSNLSGHGGSRHGGGADMMNISGHSGGLSNLSGHGGLSNLSGHDRMFAETFGVGSRRSLMSGLSRISDHSTGSVFSDLSKKIGLPASSMSNRSMAMSEVSGIDEEDDSDDEFHYEGMHVAAAKQD